MTTLVNDTFIAANNTTLSGRTPSPTTAGNNWVVSAGTWQIESNAAQNTSNSGDVQLIVNCGAADVTYTCDYITTPTKWNGGLIANYQDSSNYWLFDQTPDTFNGVLYKKIAGSYTSMATESGSGLGYSTTYNLKIVTSGDTITCYRNGIQTLTYTTTGRPLKTATGFGFRRDSSSGFVTPGWGNFLIASSAVTAIADPLWFGMTA